MDERVNGSEGEDAAFSGRQVVGELMDTAPGPTEQILNNPVLVQYFNQWHPSLRANYASPSGPNAHCEIVAHDLDAALTDQQFGPHGIFEIVPTEDRFLHPRPYSEGFWPHFDWSVHFVAVAEGVVIDPVFPGPMPLKEYLSAMFPDQRVQLKELDPDQPWPQTRPLTDKGRIILDPNNNVFDQTDRERADLYADPGQDS